MIFTTSEDCPTTTQRSKYEKKVFQPISGGVCNEERGGKERCMGIVLLCEMVQRVTSHGSEATSHDRVKEAMRRLKLFRRADLEVMTFACESVCASHTQ